MTDDVFLAHYGVKGMKWGRRKDDPSTTTQTTSARKKKIAALAVAGLGGAAIVAGKAFVSSRSSVPIDAFVSAGRVAGPGFDMSVEAYNYMRSMGLM